MSPVAVSIVHSAFSNVQAKSIELVVELADGTTVGSSRYGHSTYTTGEDSVIVGFEDGEAVHGPQTYTSTWILAEAIDPHQVVGLWVDGVCIPLD